MKDLSKMTPEERKRYFEEQKDLLLGNLCRKVLVELVSFGVGIRIPVFDILKDAKDFNVSMLIFENEELKKMKEKIRYEIEKASGGLKSMAGYYLDEEQVLRIAAMVDEANKKGALRAEEFINHYDEHLEAFLKYVEEVCLANKKGKRETKKIVEAAKKSFPSKHRIRRGCLTLHVDVDGPQAFETLSDEIKLLVLEGREQRYFLLEMQKLCKACADVTTDLLTFVHHIANGNPIPAGSPSTEKRRATYGTLARFREDIVALREIHSVDYEGRFADITDFLNNVPKLINEPTKYIDVALIGFCRLYVSLGIVDFFPFDVSEKKSAGYSREIVEMYGEDPSNAFKLLFEAASAM